MLVDFDFISKELNSLLNYLYEHSSTNKQADIVRAICHVAGYCSLVESKLLKLEKEIESLKNQSHFVDRYVSVDTGEILN